MLLHRRLFLKAAGAAALALPASIVPTIHSGSATQWFDPKEKGLEKSTNAKAQT